MVQQPGQEECHTECQAHLRVQQVHHREGCLEQGQKACQEACLEHFMVQQVRHREGCLEHLMVPQQGLEQWQWSPEQRLWPLKLSPLLLE